MMVLSIARIDGCEYEDIKTIGVDAARRHRNADKLVGWATFRKSDVLRAGESLRISYDSDPEWHAEIVEWPEDPGEHIRIQENLARIVRKNCGGVLLPEHIPV